MNRVPKWLRDWMWAAPFVWALLLWVTHGAGGESLWALTAILALLCVAIAPGASNEDD